MEGINMKGNKQSENEEEYVLLDLDDIYVSADIPANAPYVLSGLSTMNPTLVIGDQLKLIGEYQETIGTCYVFSESGVFTTKEIISRSYFYCMRYLVSLTMPLGFQNIILSDPLTVV
ncbi:uncharacterized protein [Typha angustifolia]|uniref:uncharacterized protein isoform X6 n=1 Tax=Typha angustifolia TaxID=59011 RepID=UPI003C30E8CF